MDYEGSGVFPLWFRRGYYSGHLNGQSMGNKWISTAQVSIRVADPTEKRPDAALALRDDGAHVQFNRLGTAYLPDANIHLRLSRQTEGDGSTAGWTLIDTLDRTEQYDRRGRLLSITDRQGRKHHYDYNDAGVLIRIRDDFQRSLLIEAGADGRLSQLTLPDQSTIAYEYGPTGDLTQVRFADQRTVKYEYKDPRWPGRLTGLIDERNQQIATYEYDANGYVQTAQMAGGVEKYTLSGGGSVDVTDPYGATRHYTYDYFYDRPYLTQISQPCSSCSAGGQASYSYDIDGQVIESRTFRGTRTTYERPARGLVTQVVEAKDKPEQRTTTTTWHPQFRVPTRMVETITGGTRVTVWTHDARGNPLTKSVTAPNASGQSETRTWTWTYNGLGQVLTQDGPRSDVSDVMTWTYDASNGQLASMTNAVGHVWNYTNYDAHGQLLRMTDPNGLITEYQYDNRQRLTQTTEKTSQGDPGETTTIAYTEFGEVERMTQPDGSFLAYEYDAAQRLVKITDALGHRIQYTLNNAGDRIAENTHDPDGILVLTMSRTYDILGRQQQHLGAYPGEVTSWTYDANGNPKTTTDPLSHVTSSEYDPLDRLIKNIDPVQSEIEYAYDAQDNLTRVEDPRDLVTSYQFSGFNELSRLTSPDTGVTQYVYDSAGNPKTKTDARGITSTFTFDAANRVREIRYPATAQTPIEILQFNYDEASGGDGAKGKLTSVSDGSGHTTYRYDRDGRLLEKRQQVDVGTTELTPITTAHSYNPVGQRNQTTLPSGAVLAYGYGADGRTVSIRVNGVEIAREIEYFPFGPVAGWSYHSTDRYRREFDQNGRIARHSIGAATTRELSYDLSSRINAIADSGPHAIQNWTYGYDELDRLSSALQQDRDQLQLAWTYDPTGNRLSEARSNTTLPAAPTTRYGIDPTSNRLLTVASGNTPPSRTYDPVGNTVTDEQGRASTYNGRNRLVRIQAAQTADYAHNVFGERVRKSIGAEHRQYDYDESSHLLAEYEADGTLAAEHIWLDNTPIAVLKPGSFVASHGGQMAGSMAAFQVLPDHLDTPRAILGTMNRLVWSWAGAPFGDSAADAEPSDPMGSFDYDLRFAGQQYDLEARTHFNHFRDLESTTGRYLQSDPIGLRGGPSTYLYVFNAPVQLVDLHGLAPKVTNVGTCKVHGSPQMTRGVNGPSHAADSWNWAMSASSGKKCDIYFNMEMNSIFGCGGSERPDAVVIYPDGTCDICEVTSPSQKFLDQLAKALRLLKASGRSAGHLGGGVAL